MGLGYDAVTVSRQLGHARPSITSDVYGHLFEQARVADEMHARLEEGFGYLLRGGSAGNTMSTSPALGRSLPGQET